MSYRVLLAAVAAALLGAAELHGTAHAAGDPRALLAQHAEYVGKPDALVLTYRAEPKPKASASPGADESPPQQVTYRRGALYHTIVRAAMVSTEAGFNGRAFWHANHNGYTVLALEDAARWRITANALETGAIDESAAVSTRGERTVDGKHVEVVRLVPRGGIPADVAIDPTTGAFVTVTYEPEFRFARAVAHIEGYKEIAPGVRVVSAVRTDDGTRTTLVDAKVRPVSDDELRAPSPTPRWTFGNDTPQIEMFRDSYAGRSAIVRATVNGHPGRFLLDSGAGEIILFHPFVDKLGLTMLGKTAFSGINGRAVSARYARAQTIAFGDNVLANVVVAVTGDDYPRNELDGIMGFDVLAGAVVHVDLAHETIAFGDPAAVEPTVGKGAFAFPVNLADNTPEVIVTVAKTTTRATFDTGATGFVTLSDNLKSSGRLVALGHYSMTGEGVDGIQAEPDPCYLLNEMAIGPYRYQNPTVCLGPERVWGRDGGLIGFDFLRHFNWTFDYTRSRVVLTPNGL